MRSEDKFGAIKLHNLKAASWRIVPSRFPPVSLFDRVANPADLSAILAIEALTNNRLRDETGNLELVPQVDRVSGPGTTPIMAAFTHLNPEGARFTTPYFGAWYAGLSLETAIAETRYHRAHFLSLTKEAALAIDMRVYKADVSARLHDIRALTESHPALYDRENYSAGQALGAQLKSSGSNGLIYQSVRDITGTCIAVFRPKLISNCRQTSHLRYYWDGNTITDIYEKRVDR
jgi:RES domain